MTRWLSGEGLDGQFAALELVWALSTAHSEAAYRFLRDGALIQACCGLLANVDRIMRSRILDSLKAVFGWAPSPMALLRSNSDVTLGLSGINSSNEAFHHLAQLCLLPILKSEQRRGGHNILNAFDILDILAVLGNRAENPTLIAWILDLVVGSFNIAYLTDTLPITFSSADSSLSSMAEMFLQEVREALAPSSTHKRKMQTNLLLINVFSTLDYVVSTCSVSVQTFRSLFLVTTKALSIDDIAKDQKLFKELLCALSTMLKRCGKVEDIGSVVNALMACLKSAQMRAQNAKIALELVKYIMDDDAWCTVILVPELVETLRQLLQDARWDVRDNTLEFIGDMFDCNHDSISRPTVNLAVNHSLPDAVLETMADPEPYVRSSCLAALRKITVNPRGHLYLSTHGKEHGLVRQLIASSSQDSDPLVRQSALDLLVYLVCDKRGDEMLFDLEHRLLNRELMKQVMVDVDSEVRMRGVRLLSAIFNLDGGEEDRGTWFLEIGGNELIMDAITDGSRLVRQEAYKTVKDQMLPQLESFIALKGNKRDRMSDSATLRSFACELVLLDMDNLKESCAAEHLYQEVLDVDESVLREERPRGEGNNKLACYDC
ncbi:hypothetical protein PhCBS80983_g00315 [Powellomyces hirtus]|uniref:Uncharacterized protein n=1 Tax=Powellomyces hirtus TaxID=109895 RepID=A0A507EFM8_9FUNG|nr:hypothetical protein PhCBS80983_g00315 [Powellomyces hirtus]